MKSIDSQIDLIDFFESLLSYYGRQQWWPAENAFEVVIGAILTQNTVWTNVEKAIINLKTHRVLSPEKLEEIKEETLASLIKPTGFFNQKAKRIKTFLAFLNDKYNNSIERMAQVNFEVIRSELLAINGIGAETADSVLLYACNKPTFVVDAYTKRIFSRIGYIIESMSYEELKQWIETRIPKNVPLFNEFHALLVTHGKQYCKTKPRCLECPVKTQCDYYTKHI